MTEFSPGFCSEMGRKCVDARAEIERLRAENEKLRRWRALDKPLTAAMEIANGHLAHMRAENERLRAALDDIIEEYDSPKLRDDNSDLYRAIDSARGLVELHRASGQEESRK